jgi:hypothetical protein
MAEDKRRHLRLPMQSRVFVELVAPDIGEDDSGQVVLARTLDVSRGGMRVSLEQKLAPDAIHQIAIELAKPAQTLYLAGEVRWCLARRAPQSGWTAGFALLNASGSDLASWTALLAGMEN